MNNLKQIFLFNQNQIFSIDLCTSKTVSQIISLFSIDLPFHHLESLVLGSLLLPKLTCLPRLFSLTIDIWCNWKDFSDVYRLIFNLPKLRYLKFVVMECIIIVSLPIANNKQFTAIEHLVIKHSCTIISYTPQLRYLNFLYTHSNQNIEIMLPMTLSNLTHLSIHVDYYGTFNKLVIFITKIRCKLKVLSVITRNKDITYLDDYRWEEFILKYLPQLEKFYLEYRVFSKNEHEIPMYLGKPARFTSSFWTERKWMLEIEMNFDTNYIFNSSI